MILPGTVVIKACGGVIKTSGVKEGVVQGGLGDGVGVLKE